MVTHGRTEEEKKTISISPTRVILQRIDKYVTFLYFKKLHIRVYVEERGRSEQLLNCMEKRMGIYTDQQKIYIWL